LTESRQRQARTVKGLKSAKMLVNPITASILRHLAEQEHSLAELARILGLSKSRISYHLHQLEEEKLIEKTREEIYRGGVRKFYRAMFTLQLPRLSSLSGAEQEALILPIKTFLWGYLLGKFEKSAWDFKQLVGRRIDEYAQELAETLTEMVEEGKEMGEDTADLLYLRLLSTLAKSHIMKERIKLEQIGLVQKSSKSNE
jgi:predicted transcriptional regulator